MPLLIISSFELYDGQTSKTFSLIFLWTVAQTVLFSCAEKPDRVLRCRGREQHAAVVRQHVAREAHHYYLEQIKHCKSSHFLPWLTHIECFTKRPENVCRFRAVLHVLKRQYLHIFDIWFYSGSWSTKVWFIEAFADALSQVNYFPLSGDEVPPALKSLEFILVPSSHRELFRAIMRFLLFTCGFFHWSYLKETAGPW